MGEKLSLPGGTVPAAGRGFGPSNKAEGPQLV